MDSNHKTYDYLASFTRIDGILSQPDVNYEEVDALPDRDRLTFSELRHWLGSTGAEVRLALVDSCKSGALLAVKGGARRERRGGPLQPLCRVQSVAAHSAR